MRRSIAVQQHTPMPATTADDILFFDPAARRIDRPRDSTGSQRWRPTQGSHAGCFTECDSPA